jgi:plasmid stability protein
MPTLCVENIPEDLYEALRTRARKHRTSIASEVLTLLAENVPTATELARQKQLVARSRRLRSNKPVSENGFPSAEAVLREDRDR